MSRTGLILAAHGSSADPASNALIREYAARLAALHLADEVTAAFHLGEPRFGEVVDGLTADDVTILPVMTSDGYYSDHVLPRELRRNRRYGAVRLRYTPPVGTHPGVVPLVAGRVQRRMKEYGLCVDDTALALVGHGTLRHARSGRATLDLADGLRRRKVCGEVLACYLDEEPLVDGIPQRATRPNIVAVPFLIAPGPHAAADIPRRLGLDVKCGASLPLAGRRHGLRIICDAPVGTDPAILSIMVRLVRVARSKGSVA